MATYRTHYCSDLKKEHVSKEITLSGWIFRRRDHGGVVFIDLRDTYGITQVVFHPEHAGKKLIDEVTHMPLESVIKVTGKVIAREGSQINPNMVTGEIEVDVAEMEVLSRVEELPYNISDESVPEEMRLRYRFLDLRTQRMQKNIKLRSDIITYLRKRMWEHNFKEFQTPILTASSPEGARDFLVPSRQHPGKFYALPQAPQQFKQLLMVSGFDKYFQIAPCFRDEDARADRSPGEFYQLDVEMSFVTQDEIFALMEDVIGGLFTEFSNFTGEKWAVDNTPFVRIPYKESMLKYGCDKPDLRIPLEIRDVSDVFAASNFGVFKNIVNSGGVVRAIPAPKATEKPRSWFDSTGSWAQKELNMPAPPGYISCVKHGETGETVYKGPLAKFLTTEQLEEIFTRCECSLGDVVFFTAAKENLIHKYVAPLRVKIGEDLGLQEQNTFRFCWIVDYPMFEIDEETGKMDFSHNPFSMPQGGMEALLEKDPLDILAWQYDIVCNGIELSSGAIRNHRPDIMYKAFEIAGYSPHEVDMNFGGMMRAFKNGAPPHGGIAPGIDRMVMMLADTENIREVTAYPMNQQAEDILMGAPAPAHANQLKELHLKHINLPKDEIQVAS